MPTCAILLRSWPWIACLCMAWTTGCVRRTLTIRSTPPGARVYLDGQEIGSTPVTVPFVYYGTREIRLEMQGYRTVILNQKLKRPPYEWIGIDLISESLLPGDLHDHHAVDKNLEVYQPPTEEELLNRAEAARERLRALEPWQSHPRLDQHGPRRIRPRPR